MKKIYLIAIFSFVISTSSMGQKFEFTINAGTNTTLVPNFNDIIAIANDGLVIPGFINISNSATPALIGTWKSKTIPKQGYMIQLEISKKIKDRIGLSFEGGITNLKYNYETIIDYPGTPYKKLDKSSDNYGNPKLLYFNIRPISVSYYLIPNMLKITAGPSFNYLFSSQSTKYVIVYNGDIIERVYFTGSKNFSNLLYGFHIKSSFKVLNHANVFGSYQHYFNSIYSSESSKECKPSVFELGIGYSF